MVPVSIRTSREKAHRVDEKKKKIDIPFIFSVPYLGNHNHIERRRDRMREFFFRKHVETPRRKHGKTTVYG